MVAVVSDHLPYQDLPHRNPCAQCGEPIAAPAWFEDGPHRTSYLWQCMACGYRFEAVAFFGEADRRPDAIAA
jgi:hypothetical protein